MRGLWVTVGVALVFVLLASKFFGWEFFNAANLNYWATVYGFGDADRCRCGRIRRCWWACSSTAS